MKIGAIKNTKYIIGVKYFLLLIAIIFMLAACGGGGGDDGIVGTGFDIQGTAATGDAIANATVTVKDKVGSTKSSTTDVNGKFTLNDVNGDGPFLLRVTNGTASNLYSVGHKDVASTITRNIHPFTDLIIRNWFATQNLDIDLEFDGTTAISAMPTIAEINAIEAEINNIVAQVLLNFGVAADVDLLATQFDANGTGFDAFILNSPVIINNNQITVIVNNPDLNIEGIVIDAIDLNTDFTSSVNTPPTTPVNVRALVAGASEAVVVWEASTDDKGVAGYNVYRNGTFIATTPYPVYSDTGLATATDYSYEIEAIDGRGETSARSMATTAIMLDTPDTTPPPPPGGLQAAVMDNDIALTWTQTQIDDVFGFRILRGSAGNVTTEIANITSTTYTDFNLVSTTEYCYAVIAYDASDNESAASAEICATTGGINSGPSSVSYSAATYSVSEDAVSITITVNRSGDISEAISVDYSTADNTAVAGEDYSSASGTLNWLANDSTAKTFAVQITADSMMEGDETLNLSLSSPSANTSIGTNATAVLTITDSAPVACNGELSQDITVNTTLSEACYRVTSTIDVTNAATLTVAPGVTLLFDAGTQLNINDDGALTAIGTDSQKIYFSGNQHTKGYWKGIQFTFSNNTANELDHVIIEDGGMAGNGEANLVMFGATGLPQRIKIRNTVLRNSSGYGLELSAGSLVDEFVNVTSTGNALGAAIMNPDQLSLLKAGSDFSGNDLNRVNVRSGTVTQDQTWENLNIPYEFSGFDVDSHLTLSPGMELVFNQGAQANVSESGALTAVGNAAEKIVFKGKQPTPGYWKGIQFTFTNSTFNELNHVVVSDGGLAGNGTANVVMFGTTGLPQRLKIQDTELRNSSGYGFEFSEGTNIDSFVNVTSTANELAAGILPGNLLGDLDPASQYTGNVGADELVITGNTIDVDQTWPSFNVPLRITELIDIDSALTIGSGNLLIFESGTGFRVSSSGSLSAIGTAGNEIVFTAAQATPGYWKGISFIFSNNINNILDNVLVDYAGDSGNGFGAIVLFGSSASNASRASLLNSTVQNSSTWAVWAHQESIFTSVNNLYIDNASGAESLNN